MGQHNLRYDRCPIKVARPIGGVIFDSPPHKHWASDVSQQIVSRAEVILKYIKATLTLKYFFENAETVFPFVFFESSGFQGNESSILSKKNVKKIIKQRICCLPWHPGLKKWSRASFAFESITYGEASLHPDSGGS